jgi:hypothetical protein
MRYGIACTENPVTLLLAHLLRTRCIQRCIPSRRALSFRTHSFPDGFPEWQTFHAGTGTSRVKMSNKEELKRLELNTLAMLCLRVLESDLANSDDREEASRLRREWALLIGNSRPILPGLHTQQDVETYTETLRQQMVTYLVGFSRPEAFQAQPASGSNAKASGAAAGRWK